jgi:hypothetical protein
VSFFLALFKLFASVSGNFLKSEMADLKERVCVQFCFLLGRTAAETVLMLKEAFKNEAMEVYKWFNHFKKGKCLLKTNCVVATLPQAEMTKILKTFTRLC